MENLKKQLQNIWENLAFQSKMFFKSHDSSIKWQIWLLILPMWLTLISFYLNGWCCAKMLDYISFWLSNLAMIWYMFFWKNTELYKEYWEKVLQLYKEVENYYKTKEEYNANDINNFIEQQKILNTGQYKPSVVPWSYAKVVKTIEKEMGYANESVVWWKED